jgi:hypothetical protein
MPHSQSSPDDSAPGEIPPPERIEPTSDQVDLALLQAVKRALFALPSRFKSTLNIEGVLATDLHAFNASLGASIEEQVVAALNDLRKSWDPDENYPTHQFVRSAQRFPDVTLRSMVLGDPAPPLLGIELKGWYVLSKEGEPSGRYKVTPAACAPQDLIVVVPWALTNALSGTPRLFAPYIESARYVADYRNWWWQHKRDARTARTGIASPQDATPYPARKADKILDVPESDSSGNFGRIPRLGIMNNYVAKLMQETLLGIPLWAWLEFLKPFAGEAQEEDIRNDILKVVKKMKSELSLADLHQEEFGQALIGMIRAFRPLE